MNRYLFIKKKVFLWSFLIPLYGMDLNDPDIGPIIREKNPNSVRIAAFSPINASAKADYMVVRYREISSATDLNVNSDINSDINSEINSITQSQAPWSLTSLKELKADKRYSASFHIKKLKSDCPYEYQIASIKSSPALGKDASSSTVIKTNIYKDDHWKKCTTYTFKTPDAFSDEYTFAFGSCRFFVQLFGHHFCDLQKSDLVFKTLHKMNEKKTYTIDSLLMLGDQVYTDTIKQLSWLRYTSFENIEKLHRGAKKTRGLRSLSSYVEILEIPDDHEYRDNGAPFQRATDSYAYNNAIDCINLYEHPHGPHPRPPQTHQAYNAVRDYGMILERSPCSIFLCDSRYEREEKPKKIINDNQMEALTHWIKSPPQSLSFLTTPISFALQRYEDTWYGFNDSSFEVLNALEESTLKKLFVLTGDSHSSCCSEFELFKRNKKGEKKSLNKSIVEIMSSSFYQHFHDAPNNFYDSRVVHDNRMNNSDYELQSVDALNVLRGKVIQENNFAVVNALSQKGKKSVHVDYHKPNGTKIAHHMFWGD